MTVRTIEYANTDDNSKNIFGSFSERLFSYIKCLVHFVKQLKRNFVGRFTNNSFFKENVLSTRFKSKKRNIKIFYTVDIISLNINSLMNFRQEKGDSSKESHQKLQKTSCTQAPLTL